MGQVWRRLVFLPLHSVGQDLVTCSLLLGKLRLLCVCARRKEWFGEHPASLCTQHLLRGRSRRPPHEACEQGLELRVLPAEGPQEPSIGAGWMHAKRGAVDTPGLGAREIGFKC